jgi:hypothetical protein
MKINPIILELLRAGIKMEISYREIEVPIVQEGPKQVAVEEIFWFHITNIPKTGHLDLREMPSGNLVLSARYDSVKEVHSVEDIVYEVYFWWKNQSKEGAPPPEGWGPFFEEFNLAKPETKTVWAKTAP